MESKKTVVVGVSHLPERYSYMAWKRLQKAGHVTELVNPRYQEIEGTPVKSALSEVSGPVHTVTLYVNAEKSRHLKESLIQIKPLRVIFNPGAENEFLQDDLESAGILCLNACTLVMLSTGQY